MARALRLLALILCPVSVGMGQEQKERKQEPQQVQEPPEEDEMLREKQYSFNPLQAEKEYKVGEFYFKKKSWLAAAGRFEEATKWNPGYAEAFLKLGESLEKLKQPDKAKAAYGKFLELAPEHKEAAEARKALKRL